MFVCVRVCVSVCGLMRKVGGGRKGRGLYRLARHWFAVHVNGGRSQRLPVPPFVVGDEGFHLALHFLIGQEDTFDPSDLQTDRGKQVKRETHSVDTCYLNSNRSGQNLDQLFSFPSQLLLATIQTECMMGSLV